MNTKQIRPHFVRSTHKQKQSQKQKNGTKLLLFSLKRLFIKILQKSFTVIERYGSGKRQKLAKMIHVWQRNQKRDRMDSWRKIKQYMFFQKKNIQQIKCIFTISNRCLQAAREKAFVKLLVFGKNKQKTIINSLIARRSQIFKKKLFNTEKKKLEEAFKKLKENIFKSKIFYEKIRFLSKVVKSLKQKKQRVALLSLKDFFQRIKSDKKIEELNYSKINSLQNQLKVKDRECKDLQNKLNYQNQKNRNSYPNDQNEEYKKRSFSHASLKGSRIFKSIEKDKSEFGSRVDLSIGSVLNGSFITHKSRNSSHDSIDGDCFCKYREKYNHYKCETISLKNQMEIIKKELEVTKDLNQHLQGQFTEYFCEQDKNEEAEKFKKEIKQLKKQRQLMKQKILKYQKYIATLKFQFKTKMESLYRNVKKNR